MQDPPIRPVALLSDDEAWQRLPITAEVGGPRPPLPAWARALAATLPFTTAAMLRLDFLHRARSPLDPQLRGKLRWVAAHANRCAYGEAYAAADLRRAGCDEAGVRALAGDLAEAPSPEREALEFARKLTLAASSITDDEVARLLELYGEEHVVAMVLLVAHANFQDRLALALGLSLEPGGPLEPARVRFDEGVTKDDAVPLPRKRPGGPPASTTGGGQPIDPGRSSLHVARMQEMMERQRARRPRIRVPSWDEVSERMPHGYSKKRSRTQDVLVPLGYQPVLAAASFTCAELFRREANLDRVFEYTLWWVVASTLQCFY